MADLPKERAIERLKEAGHEQNADDFLTDGHPGKALFLCQTLKAAISEKVKTSKRSTNIALAESQHLPCSKSIPAPFTGSDGGHGRKRLKTWKSNGTVRQAHAASSGTLKKL